MISAPARARYLRRAVGRAAIGHDDVVNEMARQCRNDRANGLGFVERRNHDGHSFAHRRFGPKPAMRATTVSYLQTEGLRHSSRLQAHRLQRKPQFAHVQAACRT